MHGRRLKGRGALSNPAGRYEAWREEPFDDGWGSLAERWSEPTPETEWIDDRSRTILASNRSPDVPFDRSINPYRGCEHGCIYCYARPTHNWLGLSSGLDFETRLLVKRDAAALLRRELDRPDYRCQPIALGTNTDPYQPSERHLRITRAVLEVLTECRHPFTITTKSAMVLRDLDLLEDMAAHDLVRVQISITTLDRHLARHLEPRAAAPHRRLEVLARLSRHGVPCAVMVAPVIPGLTDSEMEAILKAAAEAGCEEAGWILLRLPHDVRELFLEWLETHQPLRRRRVLSLLRQCRDGELQDGRFGTRMRGRGPYAKLLADRFARACRRLGLNCRSRPLRVDLFVPPGSAGQPDLFR